MPAACGTPPYEGEQVPGDQTPGNGALQERMVTESTPRPKCLLKRPRDAQTPGGMDTRSDLMPTSTLGD